MKIQSALLAVALSATLVACDRSESPVRTSTPTGSDTSTNVTANAPAAQPDRDTPPAETPSTHAGKPQPEATAAPTARDTPVQNPTGTLTAAEESKSMPKPGQTDNHFTPSIDGELKGTQQSPGTPATTSSTPGGAPASAAPQK